jgi:hypothetical protein
VNVPSKEAHFAMRIRIGSPAATDKWTIIVWVVILLAVLLFFYFAAVLRYFD